MAKSEETGLGPFTGAGSVLPGGLQEIRRSAMIDAGLLKPRTKYESKEAREAARSARKVSRKAARQEFLESKGLGTQPRVKLSKSERRAKASARRKGKRRIVNKALRAQPSLAKSLGIDIGRLRV